MHDPGTDECHDRPADQSDQSGDEDESIAGDRTGDRERERKRARRDQERIARQKVRALRTNDEDPTLETRDELTSLESARRPRKRS